MDPDGTISPITQTPIPNYEPPTEAEADCAKDVLKQPWCQATDLDRRTIEHASVTIALAHVEEVTARTHERVDKTKRLVQARLQHEINYWDRRAAEIR